MRRSKGTKVKAKHAPKIRYKTIRRKVGYKGGRARRLKFVRRLVAVSMHLDVVPKDDSEQPPLLAYSSNNPPGLVLKTARQAYCSSEAAQINS